MAEPLPFEPAAPAGADDLSGLPGADMALVRALLDATPARVIVLDPQEKLVYANDGFFAFTRLHPKQVLGRHVSQIIGDATYATYAPIRDRLDRGETVRWEGWTELAAQGRRYMREHIVPIAESGTRRATIVMSLDMTALKQREAELSAKVEELERAEAHKATIARQIERQREQLRQSEKLGAMGSLLAGVAHELNNPLAIVMGRTALLEDKIAALPGAEAIAADTRRIREAAERCGRIVRTFLNMARARPGERAAVQLNDLVRAAADILGYTLRSHGIRLVLALDDAVPAVHADGDQLGQIVLNLLVNAQQALAQVPAGQREVRVATGLEPVREGAARREPRVWLRVADSGPGVRDELRERLFEPFFTTKPEGVGTGLGLAVSRSIAREHGGDLVLEPGTAGASFRLSLPPSGQREAATSAAMPLDDRAARATGRPRVLVVDDEPEIAELLREMLEGAGYEVASAGSGRDALALLGTARFDAIVSDLHMPDVDGAALWREVRTREPRLARRMLFVTGDTLSPSVRQFLDRARCEGLVKPFGKAALLARMAALLTAVDDAGGARPDVP
jgi:two-component system NtrC family sensor kinase